MFPLKKKPDTVNQPERYVPGIQKELTPEELAELNANLIEWQKKYAYWLRRANLFALKLQAKGLVPGENERYQKLHKNVKVFWQKIADNRLPYQPLTK